MQRVERLGGEIARDEIRTAAQKEFVGVVPQRIVGGGNVELADVSLQRLAHALDTELRLFALDGRKAMEEDFAGTVEDTGDHRQRRQTGCYEYLLAQLKDRPARPMYFKFLTLNLFRQPPRPMQAHSVTRVTL